MFKIGDFSKLSQVSIVALRHYDRLGLFKPAYIEAQAGYRFYSETQLPRLNRIVALKDLGFTLEQIAVLLDEDVPAAQLEGMLKLRRAEVQQLIQSEMARLARIEARLKVIQKEKDMHNNEVTLKQVPAQQVAALRRVLHDPLAESGETVAGLFKTLRNYLQAQEINNPAKGFLLAHDREFTEEEIDVEAAVAIEGPVKGEGDIQVYELPAELVACTPHNGSLASFLQAHQALSGWIERNGYQIIGPSRDTAIDPGSEGSNSASPAHFEIQFPVKKDIKQK